MDQSFGLHGKWNKFPPKTWTAPVNENQREGLRLSIRSQSVSPLGFISVWERSLNLKTPGLGTSSNSVIAHNSILYCFRWLLVSWMFFGLEPGPFCLTDIRALFFGLLLGIQPFCDFLQCLLDLFLSVHSRVRYLVIDRNENASFRNWRSVYRLLDHGG